MKFHLAFYKNVVMKLVSVKDLKKNVSTLFWNSLKEYFNGWANILDDLLISPFSHTREQMPLQFHNNSQFIYSQIFWILLCYPLVGNTYIYMVQLYKSILAITRGEGATKTNTRIPLVTLEYHLLGIDIHPLISAGSANSLFDFGYTWKWQKHHKSFLTGTTMLLQWKDAPLNYFTSSLTNPMRCFEDSWEVWSVTCQH